MTTAVQHRRGTTAEHAAFTGLEGELTIDTTKDTAVIHDGTLAGGYPLAKENLANVTTSGLSSIDGASTASDDKFFIYDQSATSLKTITRAELNNAIEQDALANVAITGGTINGTTIGGTTAAGGSFTTLSASSTATLNTLASSGATLTGGTINGMAIGGTTAAAVSATTLTTSSTVTLNGGTANGVAYLNGSKVLTTGSALTFDGATLAASGTGGITHTSGGNTARMIAAAAATYWGSTTAADLVFQYNSNEQMRLTSTGLGIGTSSPGTKLDVRGTIQSVASGAGLSAISSSTFYYMNVSSTGLDTYTDANASAPMLFKTGGTERMRLDSSGNLGIGTSSPATKLHVYSTTARPITAGNASSTWSFGPTGESFAFRENSSGSDFLTISVSGNLGLGVTPSAWLSAFKAFELSSGSIAAISTNELDIGQNNFYSASLGTWAYKNTSGATQYRQTGSEHRWFTAPSGTAGNAISFTQAMTLDSSGNLGIGTTSPSTRLHVAGGSVTEVRVVSSGSLVTGSASLIRFGGSNSATSGYFGYGGSASTIDVWNSLSGAITFGTSNLERARIDSSGNITSTTSEAYLYFTSTYSVGSNTRASIRTVGAGGGSGYGGDLRFSTRAPNNAWNTDAVTIDSSGNFMVGTTSAIGKVTFTAATQTNVYVNTSGVAWGVIHNQTNAGTQYFERFDYSGTLIGSITGNNTATAYTTSSDYRLKENIQPMTGALAKVAQLKPVTYTWKADGSAGEGFIAHELAEVCPAAVTGEKDAVDADGKPQYQGIDVSFLVGTLTAAIQEQQAIIEDMKTRLAAAGI